MEAAPRFELGIKDLQSSALPLGYAAVTKESITILDCGVKEGREISSHFLYELFLGRRRGAPPPAGFCAGMAAAGGGSPVGLGEASRPSQNPHI